MMATFAFVLQTAVVTRVLFLVPFEGRRRFEALTRAVKEDARARVRFFWRFLLVWWSVFAVVLASLYLDGAHPRTIGLRKIHGAGPWLLIAACLFLLVLPLWRVRSEGPYRDAVRAQLSRARVLIPTTSEERWLFAAVCVTAGVCEELVFRGLVPAYFDKLLPGAQFVGAAASVLGFGLAHLYQGVRGVVLTALLGLALLSVSVATGSVLGAMILHAANDLRILALALLLEKPLVDGRDGTP